MACHNSNIPVQTGNQVQILMHTTILRTLFCSFSKTTTILRKFFGNYKQFEKQFKK